MMKSDFVQVQQNAELGRYATVSNAIQAGDVLIEELPFVVGPKPQTPPICLGCCSPVDGGVNGPRCPQCRWPLCGPLCPSKGLHDDAECAIFTGNRVAFQSFASANDVCMQLDCITPLRLLLAKEANPERWTREIAIMEFHEKARRDSDTWNADQINVVAYLLGPCNLNGRFTAELIQQVCGILEVNSFEARTVNGNSVRCIFPKTAIMAHSCVPNTMHTIRPSENFKIKVRATVDIAANELLYATYTYTLSGTFARQKHLRAGKFFICHCPRCIDPTELGTHFSSFKCNKCVPGLITSTDPLNEGADWKCSQCSFRTSGEAIQKAVSYIQADMDEVLTMDFTIERLQRCEELFRKYRSVLHPLHFVQTALRQALIEMYGRVKGYTLPELPDVILEHKIDLCRQLMSVLDTVHPGKTRARALLMYEMHAPLVQMARSSFEIGLLSGEPLQRKLQSTIELLQECATILEWEDNSSVESSVAKVAKDAVKQLELSISSLAE